MNLIQLIPSNSILRPWLHMMRITEVPTSYQVCVFLSVLGALLRRQVWFDQQLWRVWPNLNVMLIGPSGIGKDTVIDQGEWLLRSVGYERIVGGRTIEFLIAEMAEMGDPAACVVLAPELTAFLGQRDYQKSMVQDLTNILTTKDYLNVSQRSTGSRIIVRPTVTMLAGSTEEWLHKAMPEGSLEGGFLPRFLIMCEEYPSRHVPLVKFSLTTEEREEFAKAREEIVRGTMQVLEQFAQPREMMILSDARDVYTNWYCNRMKMFSKIVRPYANRSRDQVLRVALLSAVACGRNAIDVPDVRFGIELMRLVALKIEQAVTAPTAEASCGRTIMQMLPAKKMEIFRSVGQSFTRQTILNAIDLLVQGGRLRVHEGVFDFGEEL